KVFPGCQIVAAVDGKIFFRKSYGSHQFNDRLVLDDDLYDVASISKIAGSTTALMSLQTDGKFTLDKRFSEYLPNLMSGTPLGNAKLREVMAHQAGLVAWIPFYKATLKEGNLSDEVYKSTISPGYVKVANNIFIREEYKDTILKRILREPLGAKRYLYSDLGYYFVKEIIEQESGKSLDQFLDDQVYRKM